MNSARLAALGILASASRYSDDVQSRDRIYTATVSLETRKYVELARSSSSQYVADQDYAGKTYTVTRRYAGAIYSSDLDLQTRIAVSAIESDSSKYAADRRYSGDLYHEDQEDWRLDTKLSFADRYWIIVWDYVKRLIEESEDRVSTPGLSLDAPIVGLDYAISPSDLLLRREAISSQAASRSSSLANESSRLAVSHGYGPAFDRYSSLCASLAMKRSQMSADAAIVIGAAKANAEQGFKSQQEVARQFGAQQQVTIDSQKNRFDRVVGLFDAASIVARG